MSGVFHLCPAPITRMYTNNYRQGLFGLLPMLKKMNNKKYLSLRTPSLLLLGVMVSMLAGCRAVGVKAIVIPR